MVPSHDSERKRKERMIDAPDTLYGPAGTERVRFLKTAAQTNGEYVLVELRAEPGGAVTASRSHPSQTETLEVIAGTMGASVDGDTLEARAGDIVVVGPGKEHSWWNAGDDELVLRCELR